MSDRGLLDRPLGIVRDTIAPQSRRKLNATAGAAWPDPAGCNHTRLPERSFSGLSLRTCVHCDLPRSPQELYEVLGGGSSHRRGPDCLIEGDEPTVVSDGQGKQIAIRDLLGS